MPQALAVIGAVSSVVGTVASYSAQRKASKAATQQQELNTRRSNRQAIREAQIRRAQTLGAAAQMGALGGSSVEGGLSGLGSQLGSGLGFSSQMSALSNQIGRQQSRAALFGDVASLGFGAVQMGYQAGGQFPNFRGSSTANKAPTSANSNQLYMVGPQY
jgi:hypothetical protein